MYIITQESDKIGLRNHMEFNCSQDRIGF